MYVIGGRSLGKIEDKKGSGVIVDHILSKSMQYQAASKGSRLLS